MDENALSYEIIGAAIEVHKEVGPGALESAYEACLAVELASRGLLFEQQVILPIVYKGQRVDAGYRVDLWVNKLVIVELKAAETIHPIYYQQLKSYLVLSGCKLGLLINFNVQQLRDRGIKRIVNNL